MLTGWKRHSLASLKLLSVLSGGTHLSSAQKKWTWAKLRLCSLACCTIAVKNWRAIRPPERATRCVRFWLCASSTFLIQAAATPEAKASGSLKSINSQGSFIRLAADCARHGHGPSTTRQKLPGPKCPRDKIPAHSRPYDPRPAESDRQCSTPPRL